MPAQELISKPRACLRHRWCLDRRGVLGTTESVNGHDVQYFHASVRPARMSEVFQSGWGHACNASYQTRECRHADSSAFVCLSVVYSKVAGVVWSIAVTWGTCAISLGTAGCRRRLSRCRFGCHRDRQLKASSASSFTWPCALASTRSRRRHDAANDDYQNHSGVPAMKWLIMYRALSGCVYGTCTNTRRTSAHTAHA